MIRETTMVKPIMIFLRLPREEYLLDHIKEDLSKK